MGKLVDLLDDVFTNPRKQDAALANLSTGVKVTTEDLMQSKSKVKQAVNDFVAKHCSSHLTQIPLIH